MLQSAVRPVQSIYPVHWAELMMRLDLLLIRLAQVLQPGMRYLILLQEVSVQIVLQLPLSIHPTR